MRPRDKLIKSEIIKVFDITKEALRHYEKVGLLKPDQDEKKYRFYGFSEMAKLRQIFVLKDLGFQLEEMKLIMNKEVSQDEFAVLLSKHNTLLRKKIERYQAIQDNISMVLSLLENDKYGITFNLKEFGIRTYLMLDSEDIIEDTPKEYYDRFHEIIEQDYYNERQLVSCYDYEMLDSFESNYSKLCFDITGFENVTPNSNILTKEFSAGLYLTVFYVFRHGENNSLTNIKKEIDKYVLEKNIMIDDLNVLEFEHPELGMLLNSNEELYEIQLKVRFRHG